MTSVSPQTRPPIGKHSLRLSSRTSHFVLPKQWASMRKAEALERDTGKRVIHFEKGDFQGDDFRPDGSCRNSEQAVRTHAALSPVNRLAG